MFTEIHMWSGIWTLKPQFSSCDNGVLASNCCQPLYSNTSTFCSGNPRQCCCWGESIAQTMARLHCTTIFFSVSNLVKVTKDQVIIMVSRTFRTTISSRCFWPFKTTPKRSTFDGNKSAVALFGVIWNVYKRVLPLRRATQEPAVCLCQVKLPQQEALTDTNGQVNAHFWGGWTDCLLRRAPQKCKYELKVT